MVLLLWLLFKNYFLFLSSCCSPGTHLANLTTCSADTYTELSTWTPLVVSGERDASKGSLMLQGVLPAGRGYTSRVPSASPAGNINGKITSPGFSSYFSF